MKWIDAVTLVLAEAGHPRQTADIARRIDTLGLKPHRSEDPERTVSRTITESINKDREKSRFVRAEAGVYRLRDGFDLEKARRWLRQWLELNQLLELDDEAGGI